MSHKHFLILLLLCCLISAIDDYYKILGVNPTSPRSTIKKAYYKKSLELHPDKNAEALKNEQFILVTLSDVMRRKSYDRYLLFLKHPIQAAMVDGASSAAAQVLVSALASGMIGVTVEKLQTDYKDYVISPTEGICQWFGTAPYCKGVCPPSYETMRTHGGRSYLFLNNAPDDSFGMSCWWGYKAFCCKGWIRECYPIKKMVELLDPLESASKQMCRADEPIFIQFPIMSDINPINDPELQGIRARLLGFIVDNFGVEYKKFAAKVMNTANSRPEPSSNSAVKPKAIQPGPDASSITPSPSKAGITNNLGMVSIGAGTLLALYLVQKLMRR